MVQLHCPHVIPGAAVVEDALLDLLLRSHLLRILFFFVDADLLVISTAS